MSQHESAPARPLYDEVERIRLRNGWTKTQLARIAGVGRNTIDNWKTQPRAPLAPTVKDVAERLEIDADRALTLAGITTVELSAPGEDEPSIADLAAQLAEVRRQNSELERRFEEYLQRQRDKDTDQGKAG